MGALGLIICAVFYGTVWGVTYTNNNSHTLDTLSHTVRQVNYNLINFETTTNKHFEKLDQGQEDMRSDIQFLMDNAPVKRTYRPVVHHSVPMMGYYKDSTGTTHMVKVKP